MAGGIWAPFKEVVRVVNDAILRKEPSAYYKLEAELKKHKPDFISLLKNPVGAFKTKFSLFNRLSSSRPRMLFTGKC